MRKIRRIIVHCSDSPQGRGDDVETIRRWHLERGFDDIGYHYVILESGTVQPGRDLERAGAHCQGYNSDSVGICLIGDYSFTKDQFRALRTLVDIFENTYGKLEVHGHCYYNPQKECPRFNVEEVLR